MYKTVVNCKAVYLWDTLYVSRSYISHSTYMDSLVDADDWRPYRSWKIAFDQWTKHELKFSDHPSRESNSQLVPTELKA